MADRDNVKLVISAALIVIIASLGIYAFIYRDKISQMLPKFQSKKDFQERTISTETLTESSAFQDSPTSQDSTMGRDMSIEEEDVKNYPDIPSLGRDKNPSQSINDTPKASIEGPIEKLSPNYLDTEKIIKNKANLESAQSEDQNFKELKSPAKIETTAKSLQVSTNIPNTKTTDNQTNYPAQHSNKPLDTSNKTNTNSASPKKRNHSEKSNLSKNTKTTSLTPKSKLQSSTPIKKNKLTPNASLPSKLVSSPNSKQDKITVETRVKILEKKLNVHIQNTDTRLDSLEARIERLEKKYPSSKGN